MIPFAFKISQKSMSAGSSMGLASSQKLSVVGCELSSKNSVIRNLWVILYLQLSLSVVSSEGPGLMPHLQPKNVQL